MSKFFDYNNPICIEGQSPSIFSNDPYIQALKDLLMHEIQQIAYYIIKLDDLDYNISPERNRVIHFISIVIANLDFKRDMFNVIIEDLRTEKIRLEELYSKLCEEKGVICQSLIVSKNHKNKEFDIISEIKKDEKQSLLKSASLTTEKKNLHSIIINLIRNACLYLLEIENYSESFIEGEKAVIKLLNLMNFTSASEEKLYNKMMDFTNMNAQIIAKLNRIVLNKYGPIIEKDINLTAKQGKCILVSGHFLQDLEIVLEAVKDEDISVYTHGETIIAHSLEFFNKYPNLAGHYQHSMNNIQFDFASFPGAILITKNSQPHIDIIRGRLFTFNKHPAFGMKKLDENNLYPLIESAKNAKGFKKIKEPVLTHIGFNENEVNNKLNDIIQQISANKIKHLFIIDMNHSRGEKSSYMDTFFSLLKDDSFAISLSYPTHVENAWHIKVYSNIYLFYKILGELAKNFDLNKINLTVIFTKCDFTTISHIANTKQLNVKDIYLGDCCPSLVSPGLVEATREVFGIRTLTEDPANDLKTMLNNK